MLFRSPTDQICAQLSSLEPILFSPHARSVPETLVGSPTSPRIPVFHPGPRPSTDCTDLVPSRRRPHARTSFRRRGKARSQIPATLSCTTFPPTTKPAIGRQRPAWLPRCSIAVPHPASADCSENRLGLLGPRLAFGHRQVRVQLACRNLAAQSPTSLPWSS